MPTPALNAWLIGKNISIAVTGYTADNAGVMTVDAGGPKPFVGKTNRAELRFNPRLEEISDMSASYENDVPLKQRWEFHLEEIVKYAGSDIGLLITTFQYFKIVATVGAKAWTFYCTYGDTTFPLEMGKNLAQATFRQIDVGMANPAYA